MKDTVLYRANWIRANGSKYILEILTEFPHLTSLGMIAQDFQVLHGEAAPKLFETRLPDYAEKVLYLAKQDNKLPSELTVEDMTQGKEEAIRPNYSRRNYRHTIVKMEIKEEPCRIKDEDTEEQIDLMEVNEDEQHQFQKLHYFINEDGNAVVSKTEKNFAQKRAGKSGVKGSLTCSECGKGFIRKSNLNTHMKIHTGEKPYTCTQCGKGFIHKGHLNDHIRIHTGEKPFTCSQCGKSFSQKGALNYHLRRHSGVRSFCCDQCDKTFVFESSLNKHLNVHSAVKTYYCSGCGKSFSHLGSLKRHERIHTGVRQYVCSYCGKNYISSGALIRHQRVHTREKPYKCSHCGKSFSRSGNLKDHERLHMGEKPHQCSSCGKSYRHLSTLLKHKKNHCLKVSK